MRFLICLMILPLLSQARETESTVVKNYVNLVSAQYNAAATSAEVFQKTVEEFLRVPSTETLQVARNQWIEMRKFYSPSEVFRFYGGPIDGDNGPEGLLNSWPLDEAYIDYVVGLSNSGIINNSSLYPVISKELLMELNEKDGEKNISVGYHAIEFLLWGQDLSSTGPGNRNFTDYVVGVGKNAERRRAFLQATTSILVEKLQWLNEQWNLNRNSSYAASFLNETSKEALRRMMIGVYRLAGEELSQERMFVAYDTQSQEDEHSCFSDTTHFDIYFNFMGIKNVILETKLIELVREKDSTLATSMEDKLKETEKNISSIPGPFDNAIFNTEARAIILASITNLEDFAKLTKEAGTKLGITLE